MIIENKSGEIFPADTSASNDEVITLTTTEAGHVSTIRQTRAEHASDLAEKLKRQAKGFYTVCEAAEILAPIARIPASEYRRTVLHSNISSKALKLREPVTRNKVKGRKSRDTEDLLTTKNINKWIKTKKFDYRWPIPVTKSLSDGVETAKAKALAQPGAQPAPAVTESAPQRRARLLKWFDEEELNRSLGALNRVVAREMLQKPNADRGNIGNDIRRGRKERAAASAAGPFDGLGS